MPKPVLPLDCICHKCGVKLNKKELDSFSVGYSAGTAVRKWRRHHANCTHKQSTSVNKGDFAKMLSLLTPDEHQSVLTSVSNFAAAKKVIAAANAKAAA
jgi:hypothetical protein